MKVRASGQNLAEALMGRVKREPRLLPKPPVFTSVKAVGAKLSSGSEYQIVDQVILLGCSSFHTVCQGFFFSPSGSASAGRRPQVLKLSSIRSFK